MSRDLSSPKALVAIEKARKLLNRAYDKTSARAEREFALKRAGETLKPFGLTVEDLKQESTPDYLTSIRKSGQQFNQARGNQLARMLKKGGWKSADPSTEAYKGAMRDVPETDT